MSLLDEINVDKWMNYNTFQSRARQSGEAGRRDIGNVWQLIGMALNFTIFLGIKERKSGRESGREDDSGIVMVN